MSKYCTNCGATLEDAAVFCPECGTPFGALAAEETPAPEIRPELQEDILSEPAGPGPEPEPVRPQPETVRPEQVRQTAPPVPAPVPVPAAEPEKRSKEISTAGYFWLMLLFAVPVVGFIAMLVFACAVKNKNLRNFARAHIVWVIVALITAIALWIVARIALKAAGAEIDWRAIIDSIRNAFPFGN